VEGTISWNYNWSSREIALHAHLLVTGTFLTLVIVESYRMFSWQFCLCVHDRLLLGHSTQKILPLNLKYNFMCRNCPLTPSSFPTSHICRNSTFIPPTVETLLFSGLHTRFKVFNYRNNISCWCLPQLSVACLPIMQTGSKFKPQLGLHSELNVCFINSV